MIQPVQGLHPGMRIPDLIIGTGRWGNERDGMRDNKCTSDIFATDSADLDRFHNRAGSNLPFGQHGIARPGRLVDGYAPGVDSIII